jgi:hypothetical protein
METDNNNNNIIQFPKEKQQGVKGIHNEKDYHNEMAKYRIGFISEISEVLAQHIFIELSRTGINFDGENSEELIPSMILVEQSIQSLYLKAVDVDHPLQELAEDIYSEDSFNELVDKDVKIDYDTIIDKDKNKDD